LGLVRLLWPKGWRQHLLVVRPKTFLRWHRKGWRLNWSWKSRTRLGRPRLSREVRDLVARIFQENRLWGTERIRGELLRYLLGAEVTEVTALFDTGRAEAIELMALVLLRFSNGTLAYANGNQMSPFPLDEIVIHGTEGRIDGRGITRLGQEGDMRVRTRDAETTEHYSNKDCYGRAVAAFSRGVLAGEEPNPSGRDGLRSVQLTEAITRSVREGRTIVLDPAAA